MILSLRNEKKIQKDEAQFFILVPQWPSATSATETFLMTQLKNSGILIMKEKKLVCISFKKPRDISSR